METDRKPFLLGRCSNSHLPLPFFWTDFASQAPSPIHFNVPSASVPVEPLSGQSDQTAADRMGSCMRALTHGRWKVHAHYCIFSFLRDSVLSTDKQC